MKNRTKILIFAIISLFQVSKTNAQVSLQTGIIPVPFTFNDLKNINFINSGGSLNCVLRINISNTSGTVLTALSAPFNISEGYSNGGFLLQNNYFQKEVMQANLYNNGGYFTNGTYQIGYTLYEQGNLQMPIAQAMNSTIAGSFFPPSLISVFDEDTVNTWYPAFTWLPPHPISPTDRITYDIKIVKKQPNDNKMTAFFMNPVFYQKQELEINQFNYPSSATKLEEQNWYVWQIIAKKSNIEVGRSEIWEFYLGNIVDDKSEKYSYHPLKEVSYNGYEITTDNKLTFSFYEKYNRAPNSKIDIYIKGLYANSGNPLKVSKEIKKGINLYELDLCTLGLKDGKMYEVYINDIKNRKYSTKFMVRKENCNSNN